jgi:mRNA interferase MazF
MSDPIVVGDVVIARFPTQNPRGREQEGIRPALVIGVPQKLGIPRFPLIIVAPMTSDRNQIWAAASPTLSKIWVKTPSFEDGFKLKWKKR